jgi:hypothetical protein
MRKRYRVIERVGLAREEVSRVECTANYSRKAICDLRHAIKRVVTELSRVHRRIGDNLDVIIRVVGNAVLLPTLVGNRGNIVCVVVFDIEVPTVGMS